MADDGGTAAPVRVDGVRHASHCEVGCAANVAARAGVDLDRHVLGTQFAGSLLVREVGARPAPLLDRTHLTISAHGRGWPSVLADVAGARVTDHRVPPDALLDVLRDDLRRGGSVLFVPDDRCPWLGAGAPGLLPHTIVPSRDDGEVWEVLEGQSWWAGAYTMSTPDLRAAVHPDPDVHGIAGKVLSVAFDDARDRRDLDRLARAELRASVERFLRDDPTSTVETPAGAVREHRGPTAAAALGDALRGWSYLGDLAASERRTPEVDRDLHLGRYLLLGLGLELAFVVQSRAGTRALADDPGARSSEPEWTAAWRAVQRLARHLRTDDLDVAADALAEAGRADTAWATELADRLPDR